MGNPTKATIYVYPEQDHHYAVYAALKEWINSEDRKLEGDYSIWYDPDNDPQEIWVYADRSANCEWQCEQISKFCQTLMIEEFDCDIYTLYTTITWNREDFSL